MGFLIFFILLLIFAPYISRLLMWLLGLAARKHIEKQTRRMEDAFARAAGLDPEEERRRRRERDNVRDHGGWTTPAPKKKKIDPEQGEYIKFKEVTVDVSQTTTAESEAAGYSRRDGSSGGTTYSYTEEEQITDISWEEIRS